MIKKTLICMAFSMVLAYLAYLERGYFAIGIEYMLPFALWFLCFVLKGDHKKRKNR